MLVMKSEQLGICNIRSKIDFDRKEEGGVEIKVIGMSNTCVTQFNAMWSHSIHTRQRSQVECTERMLSICWNVLALRGQGGASWKHGNFITGTLLYPDFISLMIGSDSHPFTKNKAVALSSGGQNMMPQSVVLRCALCFELKRIGRTSSKLSLGSYLYPHLLLP